MAVLRDFTLSDFDSLYGNLDADAAASLDDPLLVLTVEDGVTTADSADNVRATVETVTGAATSSDEGTGQLICGAVAVPDGFETDEDFTMTVNFILEQLLGEVVSDDAAEWYRKRRFEARPNGMQGTESVFNLFFAGREWGRDGAAPVTAWSRQSDDVSAWVRAMEKTTQWTHTPSVRDVMAEERL